ncbi:hypothetical protein ElyMa_001074900 [Elysia marginata]|uniref:Uncharacterized protein n=1 Tax=Elysia marginata TaxID=1093978 RepID=A0AAV4HRP0_9GAST|nr:hypothetical protein ElyMa_001074900 [Elysia marginata]
MTDKDETRLLLEDPPPVQTDQTPITYKDSGAQTAIHLSHSGSSYVHSGPVKPTKGRVTPRLSNAFENSGVYQISLAWKDITVRVKVPGKRAFCGGESKPPTQKTILNNSQ